MKFIFFTLSLCIQTLFIQCTDQFLASTKQFPKFDVIPMTPDYRFGHDFDDTNTACLPTAYQLLEPKVFDSKHGIITFFPPFIRHYCKLYGNGYHALNLKDKLSYLGWKDEKKKEPICFFIYAIQDICKELNADPQTTYHITRACLRIVTGHPIDLTDDRLIPFNRDRAKENKKLLIAQISSPLREILLSSGEKHEKETTELINAVFMSIHCNEKFSSHYDLLHNPESNAVVYVLEPSLCNIIQKHNATVDAQSIIGYISPQTTADCARNLQALIIDKKHTTGELYDKKKK